MVFKAVDGGGRGREQRAPRSRLCVPLKELSAGEWEPPFQEEPLFCKTGPLTYLRKVLVKPEARVGWDRA